MRTWRERHPFLYGMCMTFGIAQHRINPPTGVEQMDRVERALREAAKEARHER